MKHFKRTRMGVVAKLEEVLTRLYQDKGRWHFRRCLFINKIISKNLLSNLIYGKDDRQLVGITIKVLQEMMTPVECLPPIQIKNQVGEGQKTILEFEKYISSSKKLFLDTRVTKALVDFIDSILQQPNAMDMNDCEMVNHCLLLIRNLFHVQPSSAMVSRKQSSSEDTYLNEETSSGTSLRAQSSSDLDSRTSSDQTEFSTEQPGTKPLLTEDQIMWNLFAQRFDTILIKLLTCQQQHLWNITMVQLISLMYREQHQGTISKLINEWLKLSLCESSTDDENNTLSSSSYDAVSTSDPVSDSSERLSPVDGNRVSKTKPLTGTNSTGDSASLNYRCPNLISSRDSGIGRSSSNNEGETSVDDSMSSCFVSKTDKMAKNDKEMEEAYDSSINGNMTEQHSVLVELPKQERMNTDIIEERPIKETLDIYSPFEGGLNEREEKSKLRTCQENENPRFCDQKEQSLEFCNPDASKNTVHILHRHLTLVEASQNRTKKPPNENESYSGDSSEKPPLHQLPKLVKGKSLLIGQKRTRHCMSQKMMCETQEMQELSNSTGSDCDEGPHTKRPLYQKPHKMLVKPRPSKLIQKAIQERNMKRTRILKRKESSGMKAKALLHHQPTPEDISNLLKEFTLDFVLNGFSTLVQGLRMQVLLPYQLDLDKSHIFWLITYFLRIAVELDLELSQICPILSVEMVSYLIYEGVVMQEKLDIALRYRNENPLPHARRLHLVVTALREFLISFDVCLRRDSSQIDSRKLNVIKDELSRLVELRQAFVFLIRTYRPEVLTLSYLQDLITTHHRFLIIQEMSPKGSNSFNMTAHLKQFATMDIMLQYGRVLENFSENGDLVNDSIFTMMHHVSGELRSVNVLLQPSILKVFLRIWKEGFELCVDWADLIEYVLRKCTKKNTQSQQGFDRSTLGQTHEIELTATDLDQLYTLYSTFSEQDLLEKIKDVCCDDSIEEPIKKEVIQKLLARGYISSTECTKLCAEIPQPETLGTLKLRHAHSNKRRLEDINENPMNIHANPQDCSTMDVTETADWAQDIQEPDHPEAKRFCFSQDEHNKKEELDNKIEAESLKTCGTSTEATFNTDYDMREELRGSDWQEHTLAAQLIDQIHQEGLDEYLQWLQNEVLEACYTKLSLINSTIPCSEPLFFHFAVSNQSIPIIPWTSEQENAIYSVHFQQLLEILGFLVFPESGKMYPRIPNFWSPVKLFNVAQKFGFIEQGSLKYSLKFLNEILQKLMSTNVTNISPKKYFEERCEEYELSSSLDCDDSPERVSDCSMQNNRSTSASPVSSVEEDFSPMYDRRLPSSMDHYQSYSIVCAMENANPEDKNSNGIMERFTNKALLDPSSENNPKTHQDLMPR